MPDDDTGFLARWSRRKALVREQAAPPEPAPAAELPPVSTAPTPPAEPDPAALPSAPPPTLDEVALLTPDADFSRFVARGVDRDVKTAALKKLFGDPRFNVMDGLDTYIDDYGKPDPLPASWLRQMTQSRWLGLFSEDQAPASKAAADATAPPPLPELPADENPDLRLQPDDAAGPAGAGPGAGQDPGREL